jgi:hypothetical protein
MSQDKTPARIAAQLRQVEGADNEHTGQMVCASDSYIKSGAYRADMTGRYVTIRGEWGTYRRWTVAPARATTARIKFQQGSAQNIKTRLQEARAVWVPDGVAV